MDEDEVKEGKRSLKDILKDFKIIPLTPLRESTWRGFIEEALWALGADRDWVAPEEIIRHIDKRYEIPEKVRIRMGSKVKDILEKMTGLGLEKNKQGMYRFLKWKEGLRPEPVSPEDIPPELRRAHHYLENQSYREVAGEVVRVLERKLKEKAKEEGISVDKPNIVSLAKGLYESRSLELNYAYFIKDA